MSASLAPSRSLVGRLSCPKRHLSHALVEWVTGLMATGKAAGPASSARPAHDGGTGAPARAHLAAKTAAGDSGSAGPPTPPPSPTCAAANPGSALPTPAAPRRRKLLTTASPRAKVTPVASSATSVRRIA